MRKVNTQNKEPQNFIVLDRIIEPFKNSGKETPVDIDSAKERVHYPLLLVIREVIDSER